MKIIAVVVLRFCLPTRAQADLELLIRLTLECVGCRCSLPDPVIITTIVIFHGAGSSTHSLAQAGLVLSHQAIVGALREMIEYSKYTC